MYVYSKKNYIPYSTFTIYKVQLHVLAISVDRLQVVHEALNDKLPLHVSEGDLHFVGCKSPQSRVDIAYR